MNEHTPFLAHEKSLKLQEEDYVKAIKHLDNSSHTSRCPECIHAMTQLMFYRQVYLLRKRTVIHE